MLVAMLVFVVLSLAVTWGPQAWIQTAAQTHRSIAVPFAVSQVLGTVVDVVFAPVFALVSVLLYYDLRIRKEGFDLEILAQEMEQRKQSGGTAES